MENYVKLLKFQIRKNVVVVNVENIAPYLGIWEIKLYLQKIGKAQKQHLRE